MTGTVFSINEFTVHDGPGCRVTVFLKGCPLRCRWCHNPEGLSPEPQLMWKSARCARCGRCYKPCSHPECRPYGRCLHACPMGLLSVSGEEWEAERLAARINSYADFLDGGGVTFSGGEPLMQIDFLEDVCRRVTVHKAVQTSGYASEETFRRMLRVADYVLMDMKLADPELHKRYTGVDNGSIHRNYQILVSSGKPHVIRVPLIPGITDTPENIGQIAEATRESRVEFVRYNGAAGAKYEMLGMDYQPGLGEPSPVDLSLFADAAYV